VIYSNLKLKQNLRDSLIRQVAKLGRPPVLYIALVGEDFASQKYVAIKQKIAAQVGIQTHLIRFSESVSFSEFQNSVHQSLLNYDGLICQLPLAAQLQPVLDLIPASKDVDFLGLEAEKLWRGGLLPPTISAIDLVLKDLLLKPEPQEILDNEIYLDLTGQTVAIVGQGKLVGSPLLRYLSQRGAGIISINKDTPSPQALTSTADILISAAGQPNLIQHDWLKPGAIVIDAATSESDGFQVGDVDVQTELPRNTILVPSPGGIGPLTVLCLFKNLINLAGFN
jgi:methylenetetrahydrofolate dehydrogenase (NADP+) / methenyltetrahydrofolate cyclohydrolase